MVAAWHVQHDAEAIAARFGADFARSDLLPWMAGVDIFFVVSGFVMVHSSARLFGQGGASRVFLLRRLIRIVPLYWTATLAFLAVALLLPGALNSRPPSPSDLAASLLFWPFVNAAGSVQPVYSLGWTLNYEMLFYGLFALALAFARTARGVAGLVALALAVLLAAQGLFGLPLPFSFWGQPIVLEFALGMAIGLARAEGARLSGALRWAFVLAAGLLFMATAAWSQGTPAAVAAFGAASALVVAAAALGRGEVAPSALVRLLARLGDASYALYLVHPFAMRALREVFVRAGMATPRLYVALALVLACVAALAVHRWFERPATRALRRRFAV